MRNKSVQMSLFDTYKDVAVSMDEEKPKLFCQLDEHIDWVQSSRPGFTWRFTRTLADRESIR